MEVREIERLLAEFYEGNTSESEEETLKEYFRTEEVPPSLLKDKKIFLGLYGNTDKEVEVPENLERKLSGLIDEKAEEEQRFFRRNRTRRNWRWVGGVAATIVLLVGIAYSIGDFGQEAQSPTPQDTFSDPKLAYEVLQSTLVEVSTNLNKGIDEVKETKMDIKKVNQEVRKEIQK
ncbi:MAG: hypothetical protein LKI39_14135 [Bacteroides sp.]|jgi:hypothetical protein|nr:hypothetical protein [Bacteroides sp.]